MLTNENTWVRRQEAYFKKLTKSQEDILKIENYYRKKKIERLRYNILNFIVERTMRLFLLFFSILVIIFCYYFYIYVK